ncbi:MAG: type I restriction-modification system subunit M N-terminal domain-containing protein, partial [Methylocella sp.]
MFEQTFKNIDDVLWKEAGCTTELDYTEQTSWILFLKYLDDLAHERALQADLHGKPYSFIIDPPHRWSKWAAPKTKDGTFKVIKPKIGDRIYDGACGSAGFLCESYDYLRAKKELSTSDLKQLQE